MAGSAVAGSAVGRRAIGGGAVAGSAVGRRAVGGGAVAGSAVSRGANGSSLVNNLLGYGCWCMVSRMGDCLFGSGWGVISRLGNRLMLCIVKALLSSLASHMGKQVSNLVRIVSFDRLNFIEGASNRVV